LGCEVGVACLYPDLVYPDTLPTSPAFETQRKVHVDEAVLALADLDYDVFYQSKLTFSKADPPARMLWMTVGHYTGPRDKVLQERTTIRGKPGFSRFPRMTMQQYDTLFANRQVFFDDRGDPLRHQFIEYFDTDRLQRILGVAAYVRRQGPEPAELKEVDRILATPKRDLKSLLRWLDSPNLSARMYALWRVENLLCGSSLHFEDETLDKVRLLLRNTPRDVWKARKDSKCVTIQRGYWPTEAEMTRAGAPGWAKGQN
jgi:hypothetical protein